MIFNSLTYIVFLACVVFLYWRLGNRYRIPLLLIGSYIFYMSWSPPFGLIYGPLIFLDSLYFYGLSVAMVRWPQAKKFFLAFGIISELLILGYFKYGAFIYQNIESLGRMAGVVVPHHDVNVFLPLAISFTNFILISYLVDISRGEERPDPSFWRFATYVAFFPHLIAGPIVRAKELLAQLDRPAIFKMENMEKGIHLFCLGFGLKVCVADVLAPYVNIIFGTPHLQGFDTSWVATYSFPVQIFCDFAGYTMMAQGSALLMGITLPENFNAPYFALNITDFWRRWHISLSRWLRDYLYIPLGGSRKSRVRTYLNLFTTMGLGGLWHGASWTFLVWGLYHGMLLSLHKLADYLKLNRMVPTLAAWFLTFHCVCIGWVFFRAQSFSTASNMLSAMFNPWNVKGLSYNVHGIQEANAHIFTGYNALTVVLLFLFIHLLVRNYRLVTSRPQWIALRNVIPVRDYALAFCYVSLIIFACIFNASSQEFIYFQF